MTAFDWDAANRRYDALKKELEAENPGIAVFYDGDEDPIHQWSAQGSDALAAELAAKRQIAHVAA